MSNAESLRIAHLAKARERQKIDTEKQLQKIEEESRKAANICQKFTANYDALEDNLRANTIGLVTLDEMKEKRIDAINYRESKIVHGSADDKPKKDSADDSKTINQKRVLSFAFDNEEEEEDLVIPVKKRMGMNPDVDTTFLPDKDREYACDREKERLAMEWKAQQEKEKQEDVTVAYVYWDGSSHRKNMTVKKGMTIAQFLGKAIEAFKSEFTALRTAIPESLMFIKEDLIIPHFYTFQDFIVARKMGKTGPLYEFHAAGDVRIHQGFSAGQPQSHPVKVVLRSWFERNKHIYPASRWEPFTPNKVYTKVDEDLSIL